MFTHEFPRKLTSNVEFIKKVERIEKDMINKKQSNNPSNHQKSSLPGKLDNNLTNEIKSICVHEFTKNHSCPFGQDCYYEHRIPKELRENADVKKEIEKRRKLLEARRMAKTTQNRATNEGTGNNSGSSASRKDNSEGKREEIDLDSFLYMLKSLIQKQQEQKPRGPMRRDTRIDRRRK